MEPARRYALVGTGHRATMFVEALSGAYADCGELVALCDPNATRMEYHCRALSARGATVPSVYSPSQFEKMVVAEQVHTVIVTTVDRTHHDYITAAIGLGCDVITEKPMTTDDAKCREILAALASTGRRLTVTFNYRYRPSNAQVKSLLRGGAIGQVRSVHFEWVLDTSHGADYFRRWHRDKRNSGGLLVHKSTHHFDLVNWWLESRPELVFAQGDLCFYGRANAEARGERHQYLRGTSEEAAGDPFAIDLRADAHLEQLYLRAEHEDAYLRDQNVFGDGISIEDTLAVLVRYENGALLTYSLTTYSPWEGYRIMFTGDRGRLEVEVCERPSLRGSVAEGVDPGYSRADTGPAAEELRHSRILLQRHWEGPTEIAVEDTEGVHGGGDDRMLDHLFRGASDDDLGQAAGPMEGAQSVLVGVAANRSVASGQPVRVRELLS